MKPFKITPITKDIIVRFSNKEIILPQDIQEKIDAYWNELIVSGKQYKRGEVFTVTQKDIADNTINILVEKTDYAHYLYSQNIDSLESIGVHIIHTAALVETSDDYFIFGVMGHQTSRSGTYQLCGGGIDNDDLRGEYFDFTHNITKELVEELNIDVTDKVRVTHFEKSYFKDGGPTDKMTVIYWVILNETKAEFLEKYNRFVEYLKSKNELPEFERVITLKKNKNEIQKFFFKENIVFDEYMKPLFSYIEERL